MANYPPKKIKKDVEPTRKNKLENYLSANEETYTVKKHNAPTEKLSSYAVGRSKEPELISKTRKAMGLDRTIGKYDPATTAKNVTKEALSRELGKKRFGDRQVNDKEFTDFMVESRQDMDELADQYKRETRGMKKGGSVKAPKATPKRRGDGCVTKGKTKGRMV